MTILNLIKTFRADEDGAVTVDWVVLTAAIVGLGIAVLSQVSSGVETATDSVSGYLDTVDVNTSPFAD